MDVARDAARLIDKILKGVNAGELLVKRPTKFKFVINFNDGPTLGLTISPVLLARADEVIE